MKKLLLATAVSALVFTGNASAVVPTIGAVGAKSVDFSAATGIANAANVAATAYFDGSSAATPFLESAIKLSAAPNSVIYKYYDSSKTAFTYIFETGATPPTGLTANKNYVVHKRDAGGSVTAILQASTLAANKALVTFNQTLPTVAGSFGAVASTVYPCSQPALNAVAPVVATCTSATLVALGVKPTTAPAVNLADVDAVQFASVLNGATAANSLATLATAAAIPSSAIAGQVFGVAVNLKLRNAMQKAMIASGALPATCTVGNETEACMANFTTADMAALFGQGRFTSWKDFRFGGAAGQNLVDAQAAADKPGNSDVHMCSRAAGSGTLASAQIVFEDAPCSSSNEAIQSPAALTIVNETGTSGSMKAYHATTSSGQLENCLETMDGYNVANSTSGATMVANGTFTPLPTFVGTANFRWAVGILNTDRNGTNALPYRFTKIDGFSPTNSNVAQGKYKFWSELSVVGVFPTAALNPLGTSLVTTMSTPATIAISNITPINFGNTGYLATAANATYDTVIAPGTLINAAFDLLRPVNPFTHADNLNTAGSVNHCRVANVLGGAKALPGLN